MKGKIKIVLAFSLSIFILLLVGIYAFRITNNYKDAADLVNYTQEAIQRSQQVLNDVQDIETAQRGYVITGDKNYLLPYKSKTSTLIEKCENLKSFLKEDAKQIVLMDSILVNCQRKLYFVKLVIQTMDSLGFDEAQDLVSTNRGEEIMTAIRNDVSSLIVAERQYLDERLKLAKTNFSSTINILTLSLLLAICIIVVTLFFFIQDYNRRIASEKKVLESEMRIKKFLDSLPIGVFVLSVDGQPYYANEKSKELLGTGILSSGNYEESNERHPVYFAKSNQKYQNDQLPIVRALKGESSIQVEDMEIEIDQQRIPVRVNATAITNSENEVEYAIGVYENISDIKAAEAILLEAKSLAEQTAQLKEAFLANMSHEIRTPMNAILGFTDLLLKRNLEDDEKDYVQTIQRSGENLLRIINDILDVSKIESGLMNIEQHDISIREVFHSLNSMFKEKTKEKGLDFKMQVDEKIPNLLQGDATRLSQILINLIGNAIKFTDEGFVSAHAELFNSDEKLQIRFRIKDSGIGISKDSLEHIFDRFKQSDKQSNRLYGGTGLGLNISKELIELQGGEISVISQEGIGTEFSFILPFSEAKSEETESIVKDKTYDIEYLKKHKLLMVEDNTINIKFMLSLLAEYGMVADVAENGQLALDKIKENDYDIVLMDIEMPVLNGLQCAEKIRQELHKEMPIIAMTANALSGEKEKCLRYGMNDYLSKPIKEKILFEKMQQVLLIAEKNKTEHFKKLTNLNFLRKTMRNNEKVIAETLAIYCSQNPEDMQAIETAIGDQDQDKIRRAAHKMKSSVSILGIKKMELILQELEMVSEKKMDNDHISLLWKVLQDLNTKSFLEIQDELQKMTTK